MTIVAEGPAVPVAVPYGDHCDLHGNLGLEGQTVTDEFPLRHRFQMHHPGVPAEGPLQRIGLLLFPEGIIHKGLPGGPVPVDQDPAAHHIHPGFGIIDGSRRTGDVQDLGSDSQLFQGPDHPFEQGELFFDPGMVGNALGPCEMGGNPPEENPVPARLKDRYGYPEIGDAETGPVHAGLQFQVNDGPLVETGCPPDGFLQHGRARNVKFHPVLQDPVQVAGVCVPHDHQGRAGGKMAVCLPGLGRGIHGEMIDPCLFQDGDHHRHPVSVGVPFDHR